LYQFLQPAIGGRGQFLKASCHNWGPDKAALKGILLDSASINSRGSVLSCSQCESRARWIAPIKKKRKKKSKVGIGKVIPNEP
jgi:hypothetical protein